MVMSRVLAVGLWLAVTVASTAMVWAATSIVAADVTDRPAAVVAHEDVVSALASGPSVSTPTPTTTSTTLRPPVTTTTIGLRGQASAPVSPSTSVPARPPVVTVAPVTPLPTPTIVPRTPSITPSVTPTTPPTTQAPARPTATYATVGGVVRVACDGLLIDLISAIPNNGYSVRVPVGGPVNVEVHFVRPGQDVTVKVVCFGQPIRYSDPTPPSRGFGGS